MGACVHYTGVCTFCSLTFANCPQPPEHSPQGSEDVQQAADTLINEVWAVVDASYMVRS